MDEPILYTLVPARPRSGVNWVLVFILLLFIAVAWIYLQTQAYQEQLQTLTAELEHERKSATEAKQANRELSDRLAGLTKQITALQQEATRLGMLQDVTEIMKTQVSMLIPPKNVFTPVTGQADPVTDPSQLWLLVFVSSGGTLVVVLGGLLAWLSRNRRYLALLSREELQDYVQQRQRRKEALLNREELQDYAQQRQWQKEALIEGE